MCTNTWGHHKRALFNAWLCYRITKMSSEVSLEQFPLTQPSWEEAQGPTREAGGQGVPPLAEPSWHRLCCAAGWHSLGLVDWVLMHRLWESTTSLSCINRGPYPLSTHTNTWVILHLHSLAVVLYFFVSRRVRQSYLGELDSLEEGHLGYE